MNAMLARTKLAIAQSGLFVILGIALIFFPEGANADKMRPGYKSHRVTGLNANTACRRPQINICQGCNVVIPMRVARDRQCGFNFTSYGPFAGQQVLAQPTHGSYTSVNETKSIYRPAPGYTGPDHFESRLYFEEAGGKRTFLTLKVNVSVVPDL